MMINKNNLLAIADYYTIMRQKGYILGYYGSTLVDNMIEKVKGKLGDNHSVVQGDGNSILY